MSKSVVFVIFLFCFYNAKAQPLNSVINVRLYGGTNPFRNSQWNNWNIGTANLSNGGSSGILKYADGTTSTISASINNQGGLSDNGAGYTNGATICPDTVLRYSSYSTITRTFTISGLNNTQKYNLQFYASRQRTDGQKTTFTIGTQSVTVSTDNNSTSAAIFSSIAPSGGSIVVKLVSSGGAYNYLNGFKIANTVVNSPPSVNAGNNQTIIFPSDSVMLNGIVAPGTSKIISTIWSQVSGPGIASLQSPASPNTAAINLTTGVYVFSLKATDSIGLSSSATVQISVLPPNPPTVSAGTNQTISFPNDSVLLNGIASAGSSKIISTIWTQTSGPGVSVIQAPASLSTIIGQLIAGTYIFNFSATDSLGLSSSASVQVSVLPPHAPSVNAGINQSFGFPQDSTILTGTLIPGSSSIISSKWTKLSGPDTGSIVNPDSVQTSIIGLVQGIYIFQLSATDSLGLSSSATVQISVLPPQPAVVNAGSDQTIVFPVDSVSLKGTVTPGSSKIISTDWIELSGPADDIVDSTILNTFAIHLTVGTYIFQLTVTDSLGLSSSATTKVIVNPPIPPTVNAGSNQTITLPLDSIGLTGVVSPGSSKIISTVWTQVSGPNTTYILNPDSTITEVNGLIGGTYIFQLSAIDSLGGLSSSNIQVTVQTTINPPVVNAGAGINIILPASSTVLNGVATQGTNKIASTTWSQTVGPNKANIVNPSSLTTNINNLVKGNYVFKLTVMDSGNLVSTSTVNVSVNAAQGHKSIGVIGSSTAAGFFNNLWPADSSWARQLFHYYQHNTIDTLYNIAVNAANIYNAMPSWYSAGNVLQPPATYASDVSRNITKIISFRPDVILCHYPSNNYDYLTTAQVMFAMRTIKASADSAGIPIFFIGTMPRGSETLATHQELLDINDSMKLQFGNRMIDYYDSVARVPRSYYMNPALWLDADSIHLNPTGHDIILRQILAANIFSSGLYAGLNQVITLPDDSTILSGSITPGNNKIVSTVWTQLSGPATATIQSPASLITQVTGLLKGTYVFQLLATDTLGATLTSSVQVLVNPIPPPTVNAGGNQTILLPVNSVTLSATVNKGGGGPVNSILWTQTSGPSTVSFSSPNSATTQAGVLIAGVYVFRVLVTDSIGNTATDSSVVTVASGASINVRLYGGSNPFKNNQWNNWNIGTANLSNGASSGILKYADGTTSTISASINNQGGLGDNGAGYTNGATICPDTVLRYSSYSTITRTLTITGLDNTRKYNLQFYASRQRTDGQKTTFTIGTQSVTVSTDNNSTSAAIFSSVSPTGGAIAIKLVSSGGAYNYLNGFKITDISGNQSNGNQQSLTGEQLVESGSSFAIQIFPNPTTDQVTVLSNNNTTVRVEIFDLMGRRLLAYSNIFYQKQISLREFPKGSYIVAVTDEKTKSGVRKIIIKN
jgi:hypothetical protein